MYKEDHILSTFIALEKDKLKMKYTNISSSVAEVGKNNLKNINITTWSFMFFQPIYVYNYVFFSIANGKNLHLVFTTELYLQLCFLYENNELE